MAKTLAATITPRGQAAPRLSLIIDGGEMGERIRTFAWHKTSLGAIVQWPQSLLTATNILLHSPVPIVMLWGADGIMIYNDAYSIFAGKRHPKLLGSNVIEGWPEVADFNRNVMAKGLLGKTLSYKDQELTLYRDNRPEEVWMDLNYSPIIGESGKPAGVWSIVVETTERVLAETKQRQAEAELLAERERLQSLFAQAPALIAVLRGNDHVFEMANPTYLRTVVQNRDVIGQPLIEAIPELRGQGVVELLNKVLRTNEPYVGEMAVRLDLTNTGTPEDVYYNIVYQPISSRADGKPDGIFVHAVDITEQVISRRRTEELNAQLEAVFESLPDGLYIAEEGVITHINQHGAEALGYKHPDDVPRKLEDLYTELSLHMVRSGKKVSIENSTLGNALRGKSIEHIGVRVINPVTGKEQTLRTAGAPIRDRSGKVIGAVAINSDLTELYKLQEKVQREAVQRRLLTQKARLLKAQNDQLTAVNKLKDEFIALTSHQLRTPATGVKQYIGMLREGYAGPVTPEQAQFLERAYNSNERQLRITDAILRVAQVDMGRVQLHKEPSDLGALVRQILDDQSNTFAERQLKLRVVVPKSPLRANIDEHQLRMAIDNIVDNAVKYTDNGKRIRVELTKLTPRLARLTITDQGVGIARSDLSMLFQKFERIPNSRSIAVGGTGLGLYWSKQIIELHSGDITADSKPGKGTTFTITLPLR